MRTLLPATFTLALVAPSAASACSACACGDPTLTTVGIDKPFNGRVRLSSQLRYRTEWTSTDAGDWLSDEARLDLGVSWAVTERIVLAANVPTLSTGLRAPNLAWDRGTGLGDVSVRARFVPIRSKNHKHLAGLTTGLEMPTAPRFHVDASPVPLDAQPGTGAWTPELGAFYGGFFGMWSVFVSSTARLSAGGFEGRTPGFTGLGTIAVQAQPHPVVAVRLSVDARGQAMDHVDGVVDEASGGWLVQSTPTLLLAPAEDVLLFVGVALPLASNLLGNRIEGVAPTLGVTVDL